MSISPCELVVRRLLAEVHNGHRLERLRAHYAPDHRDHDPRVAPGSGVAGLEAFWAELLDAVPDLRVEPGVALADGDRIMLFLLWRGTFRPGTAAERDFELHTSEIFEVAGSRITEHWAVADYSILRPLGFAPRQRTDLRRPDLIGVHTAAERANAEAVLGSYREVLTEHRLDRAEVYYERDYLHHNRQMPAVPNGVEAFRAYFAGNFAAYPDLTATVDHLVAGGDRVMVFATWRGRFTGHSRGRKPTGRALILRTSDLFRLVDNRVAEHWEVVDYSGLEDVGVPVRQPVAR
ncbi:hypothetical protein GCM10010168_23350 [Actinoplanes ianthinogenes]|uniref:Ester cyclase n=1 Tax=Actinoplanes ianthinogenes TaxID=122358 RepID=A0ABN6CRX6_9ACTN|nr:ester cyclase family protein [Actinoplanes ianthinogenes]BCJ47976.1 hypothetical protein Aiant_86330 [Actinoplanes ianthinogenes]GGR05496.1 hypothetical protein GCM10010168_23350 [Actinoplanes ianthinogenes]